ncbi:MAG: glutamine synthetase [Candidatus Lokiarchaeota archaeon]|nr:glutamine synthetase [Candidatus Lokiarchaeota archaeon]
MIEKDNPKRKGIVNEVMEVITEGNIKFTRLQFTDVNGFLKSVAISTRDLENVLQSGQSFDGSSITGFGSIEESDMVIIPDPSTFKVIPWRKKERSTCRFLCDIYLPNGQRFEGDPRYVLYKVLKKCQKEGNYEFQCAPELEFFFIEKDGNLRPTPIDMHGYFDYHPSDKTEDLRREIAEISEKFDIIIEMAHHEVAKGQHEMDFKYDEAMKTADRTVTMKMLIKSVAARKGGVNATFMPKPFQFSNGSGMHVHQSLWSNGENVFFSDDEESGYLSKTALNFIGGQLKYAREICAILASWPNSYKRLVPGYEAPVYVAWGFRNRSPLIRVPNFYKKKKAARVEIRCPDPAGNIYLILAVLAYTGLLGIKDEMEPPEPTDLNVYELSHRQRIDLGITSLPESLGEALKELESSDVAKEALGEVIYDNFLKVKWEEWDAYRTQVSEWEINRYLEKL